MSWNRITNVDVFCEYILIVIAAGFHTIFFHLQTMDSINLDVLHSQAKKKRVSTDLQFLSQCVHNSVSIICGLPEKSTLLSLNRGFSIAQSYLCINPAFVVTYLLVSDFSLHQIVCVCVCSCTGKVVGTKVLIFVENMTIVYS